MTSWQAAAMRGFLSLSAGARASRAVYATMAWGLGGGTDPVSLVVGKGTFTKGFMNLFQGSFLRVTGWPHRSAFQRLPVRHLAEWPSHSPPLGWAVFEVGLLSSAGVVAVLDADGLVPGRGRPCE